MRPPAADRPLLDTSALCLVAWLVPGGGHVWLGRRRSGFVFLAAISLMFALGLGLDGRLFPFTFAEPLVGLAAVATAATGALYLAAWALGLGAGVVTAASYEYANAFLIVSGLLNMLVVLDAYDVALGRK